MRIDPARNAVSRSLLIGIHNDDWKPPRLQRAGRGACHARTSSAIRSVIVEGLLRVKRDDLAVVSSGA